MEKVTTWFEVISRAYGKALSCFLFLSLFLKSIQMIKAGKRHISEQTCTTNPHLIFLQIYIFSFHNTWLHRKKTNQLPPTTAIKVTPAAHNNSDSAWMNHIWRARSHFHPKYNYTHAAVCTHIHPQSRTQTHIHTHTHTHAGALCKQSHLDQTDNIYYSPRTPWCLWASGRISSAHLSSPAHSFSARSLKVNEGERGLC